MREGGDNPDEGGYWQNPPNWPTHKGSDALWEELGRTVATFGMLEDTPARAHFHVTGQQQLRAASSWRAFRQNMDAAFPKFGTTCALLLDRPND